MMYISEHRTPFVARRIAVAGVFWVHFSANKVKRKVMHAGERHFIYVLRVAFCYRHGTSGSSWDAGMIVRALHKTWRNTVKLGRYLQECQEERCGRPKWTTSPPSGSNFLKIST